jgi:serine/threonine protein phosphatase 1
MHGCDAALARLLDEIKPQPTDTIVGLGDYVDRGPDSRSIIDRLLRLQETCQTVFLLGNHELMMRSALIDATDSDFWLRSGGAATVESYGNELENIPDSHLAFLNACVPYYEIEDFFFVHANFTPSLTLDRQPDFALFWEHLTAHMPSPHISGKTAVLGHTPQRSGEVLDVDHLICLDTFCCGGGWLTAMDVERRKVWQADRNGEFRTQESVAE